MDLETARKLDLFLYHIRQVDRNDVINISEIFSRVDKDKKTAIMLLERLKKDGHINDRYQSISNHSYVVELTNKLAEDEKKEEERESNLKANNATIISAKVGFYSFAVSVLALLVAIIAVIVSIPGCLK